MPADDPRVAAREITDLFLQQWAATATLAAVELGVADALGEAPSRVEALAAAIGADADALRRLLRGLAASGVFRETEPGTFAHTPRSAALRRGAPGDARAVIRMFGLRSTREATIEYAHAVRSGRSAFEKVHGTANPFDVLAARPDEAAAYHDGMSVEAQGAALVARRLPLDGVTTLVDVGGGRGVLIAAALAQHPALHGVLFDLPEVVAGAGELLAARGVADRCEVRGGDLRGELPSADAYVLKNILHGWPDEDCRGLLARIREAARPRARVLVVENVMPAGNDPAPCKTFDLFLLLGGNRSRVRSAEEFGALFEAAGLVFQRVVRVFGDQGVVEASLP